MNMSPARDTNARHGRDGSVGPRGMTLILEVRRREKRRVISPRLSPPHMLARRELDDREPERGGGRVTGRTWSRRLWWAAVGRPAPCRDMAPPSGRPK